MLYLPTIISVVWSLRATGGCSPYIPHPVFFVNLGSWAKSKTSELHTKLPEGTSFWPFGILKHMMATAMYYRVSWWLEHAQANSERITLTTWHYTSCSTKYQLHSVTSCMNHLAPQMEKTIYSHHNIHVRWFDHQLPLIQDELLAGSAHKFSW